jgi:ammonium transporter, Amt family
MQAGFAMLCAGCVQLKNVQNTMLKNLLDACGSAVAFYLMGKDFIHSQVEVVSCSDYFCDG